MLELLRTPGPVRRFLAASLQSSIGNMVAYIALLLVAYDLTKSAWAVSAVLLAECVPALLLAPLCGALADRCSRRVLVVAADLLRCAAFVALAFAGSLPLVIAFALVAGVGQALYQPAAKAALPGLAGERADAAMGALVASWSAAVLVGPAVGAGLLLVLSPADLLLVNAATFVVSAIVLSRLPLGRAARTAAAADEEATSIANGLRAVRGIPGLATLIAAGGAATLAFSLMNLAEPLLARAELRTTAVGFAVLVGAFGIGSTLGALRGRPDGKLLLATLVGCGAALLASAFAPSVAVAAVTFLVTGLFAGAFMSCEHQLIARLAPDDVRGRVFGIKDALDAGALCLAFVGGAVVASHTDARVAFAVSGVATLTVALLVTMPLVRAGIVSIPRRKATAPRIGALATGRADAGA